nr:hypothetical protein VIGAN_04409100 [Ipomoea trifida]
MSVMVGLSFPSKFTQSIAVYATSSTASASAILSGRPTLPSKIFSSSPAMITGTAYSTTLIGATPSLPFLKIALFPVKSSSRTTPSPYTSLFAVKMFSP